MKFKLVIAYDGTAYQGWQVQKIGTGVQEKIEAAFGQMFPSVKRIHSSSRTDTGVHALGMVAHVEIPRAEFKMPVGRLALALNAFLPDDIRVLSAARVREKFHARFDATGKQYRYYVWNHPAMNPLLQNRAWHFPMKLDLAKMRAAAKLFIGKHDFRCFAGTRSYEMESNVRTLKRCDLKKSGAQITFIIEGDGFLYKMCRASWARSCRSARENSAGARGGNSRQPRPPRRRHDRAGARAGAVEGFLQVQGPKSKVQSVKPPCTLF